MFRIKVLYTVFSYKHIQKLRDLFLGQVSENSLPKYVENYAWDIEKKGVHQITVSLWWWIQMRRVQTPPHMRPNGYVIYY